MPNAAAIASSPAETYIPRRRLRCLRFPAPSACTPLERPWDIIAMVT